MRSLLFGVSLCLVACGGTKPCKDGTVFLNVSFVGASTDADSLTIDAALGPAQQRSATAPGPNGQSSGSIQVEFGEGYPSGKMLLIRVTATRGGTVVGVGTGSVELAGACASLNVLVSGGGGGDDMSVPPPDMSMAKIDMTVKQDMTTVPQDLLGLDLIGVDLTTVPPDMTTVPPDMIPCTPANAAADHYVDPINGVDDTMHGRGPGGCALKTLTFALTRASDQIFLSGNARAISGETFPLVLTGKQRIECRATTDSIVGNGQYSAPNLTGTATMVFKGTANNLTGCAVGGGVATVTAGLFVETNGTHSVGKSQFSKYAQGAGIIVPMGLDQVVIDGSMFDGNQYGIFYFTGAGLNGTKANMTRNQFDTNSTRDIQCSSTTGTAGIGGNMNANGLAKPTCFNCANCAFD
jgi:hypothetical protein